MLTSFLLVETRSLWESQDVAGFLTLAAELAEAGHSVDVFLIQNAVLMTRDAVDALAGLVRSRTVTLWADGLSLVTRAIPPASVPETVRVADTKAMVHLMTRAGSKTIWH